jgi:hypothetical protein
MNLNLGVFVGMNPQLSIARVINLISEESQLSGRSANRK